MISQGVGGEKSLPRVQGFHRIMVLQARKASPPRGPADLCSLVAQWHPTLSDVYGNLPMGILQERTLEWVAISFFKRSSWPKDQTHVSCIGRWILYHWAIWEALEPSWPQTKKSIVWAKMCGQELSQRRIRRPNCRNRETATGGGEGALICLNVQHVQMWMIQIPKLSSTDGCLGRTPNDQAPTVTEWGSVVSNDEFSFVLKSGLQRSLMEKWSLTGFRTKEASSSWKILILSLATPRSWILEHRRFLWDVSYSLLCSQVSRAQQTSWHTPGFHKTPTFRV